MNLLTLTVRIIAMQTVITMLSLQCVNGQQYVFDDFEDGDVRDGAPIRWQGGGQLAAEDGKMHISGAGTFIATAVAARQPGWSIQTRASLESGNFIGLGVAFNGGNVWMGIQHSNLLSVGTPGVFLDSVLTDLEPDDVMLRFDAFDDSISAWAWHPDEAMPLEPMVVAETRLQPGVPGVWLGDPAGTGIALFEFVEAATIPLPDLIEGDFDLDQTLGAGDIDLLSTAVRTQAGLNRRYDLNHDGSVDEVDRQHWINELRITWMGDANLDGQFNSSDFVAVFASGEFEDDIIGNSTWATGDWNGDAEFDTGDFVAAFQHGGYDKGPKIVAVAVPEPSEFVLLLIGFCTIILYGCRRI